MKKGMSILLTFVLVISLAFSFSFSVFARTGEFSFISGDAIGSFNGVSGNNNFFVTLSDPDSSGIISDSYTSSSPVQANGSVVIPELNVHFAASDVVNAGDIVRFEFRVSVSSVSGVNKNPYINGGSLVLANPGGITDFQYNTEVRSSLNSCVIYYHCYFRVTSFALYQVKLQDIKTTYSVDNISTSGYMQYTVGRFIFQHAPDNLSDYDTVLNEIKDNTAATQDAVNQQGDSIKNGYDNSGMNDSNDQLSGSLGQYDQAESQITDQAHSYIEDINLSAPTYAAGIMSAISFSASFLQSLFVSFGIFNMVIVLSLTLTFVMMLIGWFRFRK